MKLTLLILTALASTINGAALLAERIVPRQNNPPPNASLKITSYKLVGNGCPEKTSGSIKYLDGATLTLIFDKFHAYSLPGKRNVTVECEVTVELDFVSRFKAGNLTDILRGDATIPKDATWLLNVATTWLQEKEVMPAPTIPVSYGSPWDRTFTVTTIRPAPFANPYCYPFHGTVRENFRFDLSNRGSDAAVVQVYSLDFTIRVDLYPKTSTCRDIS